MKFVNEVLSQSQFETQPQVLLADASSDDFSTLRCPHGGGDRRNDLAAGDDRFEFAGKEALVCSEINHTAGRNSLKAGNAGRIALNLGGLKSIASDDGFFLSATKRALFYRHADVDDAHVERLAVGLFETLNALYALVDHFHFLTPVGVPELGRTNRVPVLGH